MASLLMFIPTAYADAQHNRPFWTEKSSYIEGDYLYVVGVATNVDREEEGRILAYQNGVREISNYAHVSGLGDVPIETQMTHTEHLATGKLNVYRLLKVDRHKLLELRKRQIESGLPDDRKRYEEELRSLNLELSETRATLRDVTSKQLLMEKDAEIRALQKREREIQERHRSVQQKLESMQREINALRKTPPSPATEEMVMLNVKSKVFHCPTCEWAKKCTVNCVRMSLSEAVKLGGRPCRTCKGTCR